MRNTIFTVMSLLLIAANAFAAEGTVTIPEGITAELHGTATMQYDGYVGDDDEDANYTVPPNEIMVRRAALEVSGEIGKYVDYNVEMGMSTCVAAAGPNVTISDASVFVSPTDYISAGIMKGHFLRGFTRREECDALLVVEKARFLMPFFACHPIGAVLKSSYDFTETVGYEFELAYLNGPAGNLDDAYNINVGAIFHTPLPGLSACVFYEDVKTDFELDDITDKANRIGAGVNFENYGISARGEYYMVNGFNPAAGVVLPDGVTAEDLENRAYYFIAGYRLALPIEMLPYLEPHVLYQSWDKGSNLDADYEYTYVSGGISVGLGDFEDVTARFMLDYETPIASPDGTYEEADRIYARLQASF